MSAGSRRLRISLADCLTDMRKVPRSPPPGRPSSLVDSQYVPERRGPAAIISLLVSTTRPGELHAEINEALRADGPAIVDCVVVADEMPNFPHLDLDKVGRYAVAKIKEAVLSFTGQ